MWESNSFHPASAAFFPGLLLSLGGAVLAADDYTPLPVQKQVDTALHSVLLVAGVLVVLILVAIAIIVYRKVFASIGRRDAGAAGRPARRGRRGGETR